MAINYWDEEEGGSPYDAPGGPSYVPPDASSGPIDVAPPQEAGPAPNITPTGADTGGGGNNGGGAGDQNDPYPGHSFDPGSGQWVPTDPTNPGPSQGPYPGYSTDPNNPGYPGYVPPSQRAPGSGGPGDPAYDANPRDFMIGRDQASWEAYLKQQLGPLYDKTTLQSAIANVSYAQNAGRDPKQILDGIIAKEKLRTSDTPGGSAYTQSATPWGGGSITNPLKAAPTTAGGTGKASLTPAQITDAYQKAHGRPPSADELASELYNSQYYSPAYVLNTIATRANNVPGAGTMAGFGTSYAGGSPWLGGGGAPVTTDPYMIGGYRLGGSSPSEGILPPGGDNGARLGSSSPFEGLPSSATGPFGMPADLMDPWSRVFSAPDPNQILDNPLVKSRIALGMDTIQKGAAGRGTLLTPGVQKSIADFAGTTGSDEYWNLYNAAQQEYQNAYNMFEGDKSRRQSAWLGGGNLGLGYGNLALGYGNLGLNTVLGLGDLGERQKMNNFGIVQGNRNYDLTANDQAFNQNRTGTMDAFNIYNTLDNNYYSRLFTGAGMGQPQ